MVNISTFGDSAIKFTFTDSDHYLYGNGEITVPVNSLLLVVDESDMVTFKKPDGDSFISFNISNSNFASKAALEAFYKENMTGGGGLPTEEIQELIDQSISGMADNASYDSVSQEIKFYNGNTEVYSVDASDFVIDGMIEDVRIETISGVSYLVIDFNTASGKEDIQIPLTDIFDPSNYYTKQEVDASLSGKQNTLIEGVGIDIDDNVISVENPTVYLTQAEYDALVSGGTVDPDTYYVISDATAIDINQYYTSAQTESAITAAVSGKQDTLSAGTGIDITNNVISTKLPISAGTGNNSAVIGSGNTATGVSSVAINEMNNANGNYSFAAGFGCNTNNGNEAAFGFCSSSKGHESTVTGSSGATLFEVGNGSFYGVHNAIEIMQNGDIYVSDVDSTTTSYWYQKPMVRLQDTIAATAANTQAISGKVDSSSVVTAVTSGSTDSEIPTAKAVFDAIPTGSSITVSSAITSGDTNPVEGGVLYDELRVTDENVTVLEWDNHDGGESTNYPSGGTVAKLEFIVDESQMTDGYFNFVSDIEQDNVGYIYISSTGGTVTVTDSSAVTYSISGNVVTVTYPTIAPLVTYLSSSYDCYWTVNAIYETVVPLKDKVVALDGVNDRLSEDEEVTAAALNLLNDRVSEDEEVTAAGLNAVNDKFDGLQLKKLTQQQYDALTVKDQNTLYIIVN